MSRTLDLREHQQRGPVALSTAELAALQTAIPDLAVRPVPGAPGCYDLRPGSTVGALDIGDLGITIRPKVEIDRLLFLLSYTFDPKRWRDSVFDFEQRDSLVEAVIPGFLYHLRNVLRRGLLQGYRTREEALAGVKGRIRFDDQLRLRHGIFPPVEVTYDDFTEDVLLNQILKAAVVWLGKLRLRNPANRRALARMEVPLGRVSLVQFPAGGPPAPEYSRLNEHYRPAVELARWILRATSFDLEPGQVRARGFLVDMNRVFEDFVVAALRDALTLSEREFPQNAAGRSMSLDLAHQIRLRPDISWWSGSRCIFVGDVKYKDLTSSVIKHGDLYQLLAYLTATNLDTGVLIYAAGEGTPGVHRLRHGDRELRVHNLRLDRPPDQILQQVASLAQEIEHLARSGRRMRAAAISS